MPCISPSQLVGCKGRAKPGSQLEQPVPNTHGGFVGRATHQNTPFLQSASLAVPSAQEKPLPLPWKGQISVFAKDNKFTGKRSRHSRQNLKCSPRILLSPNLCLPLGLPSGDERNCTICLKRNHKKQKRKQMKKYWQYGFCNPTDQIWELGMGGHQVPNIHLAALPAKASCSRAEGPH